MKIPKVDQEILDKYFKGKIIKRVLKTPYIRSYVSTDDEACTIATPSKKNVVSSTLAVVASQKGWNLSVQSERHLLVCLLRP